MTFQHEQKRRVICIIAILCIFPLIFFCDNFHVMLLAWDGKLSLEIKEARGIANEIDTKLTTSSQVKSDKQISP